MGVNLCHSIIQQTSKNGKFRTKTITTDKSTKTKALNLHKVPGSYKQHPDT